MGWLVVAGAAGAAQAQPAQPADPALARCVNATREQLAELNQALTAGQARHRANPVMVSRLQTLDAELQPLRARLGRETRGLPECEQLSQTLAAEHERLARIAGPDPQVADCMTANAQVLREALQALDTAAKAAPARPTQAAQAQVALKRLEDLRPVLARESQNLAACRQLSASLAQEKQQASALQSAATSADPMAESAALAACRAAVVDSYADTRQAWRDAASGWPEGRPSRGGRCQCPDAPMARNGGQAPGHAGRMPDPEPGPGAGENPSRQPGQSAQARVGLTSSAGACRVGAARLAPVAGHDLPFSRG